MVMCWKAILMETLIVILIVTLIVIVYDALISSYDVCASCDVYVYQNPLLTAWSDGVNLSCDDGYTDLHRSHSLPPVVTDYDS